MKVTLKIICTILAILYPFGVYFGVKYFELRVLSLLLLGVAFSYFLSSAKTSPLKAWQKYIVTVIICTLILLIQVFNNILFIKLYPVLMNLFFLYVFTYTLVVPPSMIEKFARLKHQSLPPEAILYTRKVTIIWCGLLFFNSIASLYTAFYTTIDIWTLYNGLISYCLIGALFVGEYIVRCFVIRKGL